MSVCVASGCRVVGSTKVLLTVNNSLHSYSTLC